MKQELKTLSFLILGLCLILVFALSFQKIQHQIQKAKKIQLSIDEMVSQEAWIADYLAMVEELHFKHSRFALKSYSLKHPAIATILEKLHLFDGWKSVEEILKTLAEKTGMVPRYLVRYPANLWLPESVTLSEPLHVKDIKKHILPTIYNLSQHTESYSLEGLKEVIQYRNFVDGECAKLTTPDSWVQQIANSILSKDRFKIPSQSSQKFDWTTKLSNVSTKKLGQLSKAYKFPRPKIDWSSISTKMPFAKRWPSEETAQLCSHLSDTVIEPDWQNWFENSEYEKDYLPRMVSKHRARLSTVKHATLEVCNFAPYKTQSVLQYAVDPTNFKVSGWYLYEVGECRTFNRDFIDIEPRFWVHMQNREKELFEWTTQKVNKAILNDANQNNDEYIVKITDNSKNIKSDLSQCVPYEAFEKTGKFTDDSQCLEGQDRLSFTSAMQENDSSDKWFYFVEHPNAVMFNPSKPPSDTVAKNEATKRVQALYESVKRQKEFEDQYNTENVPVSLGTTLYDHNGPLSPGIMILDRARESIGGEALPYLDGDVLVTLNGKVIYGISDLYGVLLEHAYSLSAGYRKPIYVGLEREDKIAVYQTSYFFNPSFYLYDDVTFMEAFIRGAILPTTLGFTPEVKCYGTNGLLLGLNLLNGAIDGVLSFLEDRPFNKKKLSEFKYINTKKCIWVDEQREAVAEQKHKKIFMDSQWFALFTPSSVRLIGQKSMRSYCKKKLANRKWATALADGALEGIETGLWVLGTSAPELSLEGRMKKIKTIAPFSIGIGYVSGLVFPH